VINRACEVFDRVVVAVVDNPSKEPLFTAQERVVLLEDMIGEQAEVKSFSGLLVEFARAEEVDVIVKGLRAVSDFDYELQMAQMNRTLSGVETVFMATNPAWGYLSSSLVREVARMGGSVEALVPANVAVAVKEKLR
jgi:pantetheine-phosphate adenylyltransferase